MSVLANEVHEYLSRTKRKMDLRGLYSRYMVSKPLMVKTIQELVDSGRLEIISAKGKRLYNARETGNEATPPIRYVMRPYQPSALLTERQREIEAQRAAFPSRFHD